MLLKLQEVARELNVALVTVRRYTQSGALRCIRMGRAIRVDSNDLLAFIEARRT